MEYKEIQGLLDIWLEEDFKLKGYTPTPVATNLGRGWKKILN